MPENNAPETNGDSISFKVPTRFLTKTLLPWLLSGAAMAYGVARTIPSSDSPVIVAPPAMVDRLAKCENQVELNAQKYALEMGAVKAELEKLNRKQDRILERMR